MSVSVVIPCHGGAELTSACVHSLLAQSPSAPDEIVLVDNNGRDDTGRLAELDPRIRVVRLAENRGFAGGVNAGIRAAKSELVLVLNNDTQAADRMLHELRSVLHSDPRIAAAAPVSNHVKGEARIDVGTSGREPSQRAALQQQLAEVSARRQDVANLAGLCLLVRRRTLDEVGPFDERFGHGNYEDDDFCLRLRLRGHRLVIARRAFLHHEGHATFRRLGIDLVDELRRRRHQFDRKWRGDPAGAATIAAWDGDTAAAAAAASAARGAWSGWHDAHWHLGLDARLRHDFARAAMHFAAFVRACPEHTAAQLHLAACQLATQQTEAGLRRLRTTLAHCALTSGQQAFVLQLLGEHEREHGCLATAERWYRAALRHRPQDGALQNGLGLCLLARGEHAAAADCFSAAIECGFTLAHTNLGICQHARGDRNAAIASFARAVELCPDDPAARANHRALVGASA